MNRGNHGDADAGHDASRADRSRADANLDGVDAAIDQGLGGFRRGHVPGDDLDLLEGASEALDHVQHALRMSVCGVDHQHIDVGRDQGVRTLERVARDADRGADAEAPQRILAGVGILDGLLDVLDRDEALQPEIVIDDEELLDLLLVQDFLGFVERGANRHGDQVALGHHIRDRSIDIGLEPQIAIGQDPDEPPFLAAVLRNRDPRNAVFAHQVEGFTDPARGRQRDRIDDHAAFRALDAVHFRCLVLDRQILVNDAQSAVLGHRDGHLRLGDRVHGGAESGTLRAMLRVSRVLTSTCAGTTVECRGTSRMSSKVSAVRRPASRESWVGSSNFVWAITDYKATSRSTAYG